VPLRSLPLQRQIVDAARAFEERIKIERSEFAKTQLLKAGLMADLLTGLVRVPEESTS
jgi:restriction endonuclease S subunit